VEYQSEIRDSQINELLEKVENQNYAKYLYELKLVNVRGFKDEAVHFDFPVTALIGPNGGGKTTVLGAASCAYKETKPGRFFSKSGLYDNSMQNWKIEYKIIDKANSPKGLITRTSTFTSLKWTRDNLLSRETHIFGVNRTVPASERAELKKCANTRFAVPADQIVPIGENICNCVEKILDKNIDNFSSIKIARNGKITLLSGLTDDGLTYSEFHFGAGESSIIRMVIEIEGCQDYSLILIEEIENGLHPLATIRLVEYLIEVAARKKLQVIFTTHSNDALIPLPHKAIWVALNNKLFPGKLDIRSLRAINGQVSSQLVVFVEDLFAQKWIEAILNSSEEFAQGSVEVHAMHGDGTAVEITKSHNRNPAIDKPAICFLDGDSMQAEDAAESIYRLLGEMPESYIFLKIKDDIDDILGELTVALHKPYELQDKVKQVLDDVWRTNRDRHLLYSQIGKRLGFISEEVVRSAFLNLWCQHNKSEVESILTLVREKLVQDIN
jgi:hypothetical protein